MKKYFKYLLFLSLIYISCEPTELPGVVKMSVTPEDTLEISTRKDASFYVKINTNEDLKSLKVTTQPYIYQKDTIWNSFIHNAEFPVTMSLPVAFTPPEDSIIKVYFAAKDYVSDTSITRYLRIVKAPPYTNEFTVHLEQQPFGNMFYSTLLNISYAHYSVDAATTDFAFIYDESFGAILCSPNSKIIATKLSDYGIDYNVENKRLTKIQKISGSWNKMDDYFINDLEVTQEYINSEPELGIGVEQLSNGDILAFVTEDGRKGLIYIQSVTKSGKVINFTLKVQKE